LGFESTKANEKRQPGDWRIFFSALRDNLYEIGKAMLPRSAIAMIAVITVAGQSGPPQISHAGRPEHGVPLYVLERPLRLRDGIGQAHEGVTTSSADAQAYYDQGLAYHHSYEWIEAARSFNQALRLDPQLAMAYLGLSYALGELGEYEAARRAGEQAVALAGHVTDRERTRINLRAEQLRAAVQPELPSLRAIYQKEVNQALARYPKDVELLLLRGQAEETKHEAPGMGGGQGSVPFYERALAERPNYFAAHHYLTHAYENLGRVDRALEHASEYARLAPSVPHAHHMYGHVLRRANLMQDAIAEFHRADELELAYLKRENIAPEWDWHYHHNLDLLGVCYEYSGQIRLAESVLRRSFELPSIQLSQELNEDAWPELLLLEGRPEPALAASKTLVARDEPVVQALGHLIASRSLMALKRMDEATKEGDEAVRQMRAVKLGGFLVPELEMTQGEFLLRKGQAERGRAMLRGAAAKLRADPRADTWTQTLLRLSALWYLSQNLHDKILLAEFAKQLQEYDPNYPGSHYALAKAAEEEGNIVAARKHYQLAIEGWKAADADFASLVDARHRLAVLQKSVLNPESPKRP
jgi:tetratricopeptide (TPR) repeat protein